MEQQIRHTRPDRAASTARAGARPRPGLEKLLDVERPPTRSPFAAVEEALEDIAAGKMVVVVDDEDRENEGDLVMAAEFVTAEAINFMATHARGLICLALTAERCDELGLDLMAARTSRPGTPFTVTIEAREGVTTGISAADRAHTIRVAVDPEKAPQDIVQRGHVNPLKARPAACWSAPATPRPRSTSRGWPAACRPA